MINSHLQAETPLSQRKEPHQEQKKMELCLELKKSSSSGTESNQEVLICDDVRGRLGFSVTRMTLALRDAKL